MKSIVFAVTNDLSYDRRMRRICTTLCNAGYSVELIGRRRKESVNLQHAPFKQRRLHCLFSKGALFYAEYNIRLCFVLLAHRANVFGACDLDTALAVVLAAKIKGRKSVFDAHEHFTEVPEVERRRFVKSVWHAIGNFCIPRFTKRFTVGEKLSDTLYSTYGARFSVVRNLPELHDTKIVSVEQRQKIIVYQGALNEGRGLEHAIAAMQRIPDFTLRLIGEGDLSQQLRGQVRDLQLASRVEFVGFILPENLRDMTSDAMVGLNLLDERSKSYYFSLANKFFDYMHAGVPSLNMCFPEYEVILSRHKVGMCIANLTADAIADAILRMTSDTGEYAKMVTTCTTARLEYTWQREEKVLLEIVNTL